MKYREILSVPGVAGLFKLIATNKNNIIIESLNDGKRQSLAINHKISSLSDIYVFTKDEDMPLADVFKKMREAEDKNVTINTKVEPEEMKKYFHNLIPDIDDERVHHSHMRKILTWYEILKNKIDFTKLDEEDGENPTLPGEGDKQQHGVKLHETHAPKADQHAKVTPVKLRKKV
jgi:hypothetical protein